MSELAQDTTRTLLSVKMNTNVCPSVSVPDMKVLAAWRKAVSAYNQEHHDLDGK